MTVVYGQKSSIFFFNMNVPEIGSSRSFGGRRKREVTLYEDTMKQSTFHVLFKLQLVSLTACFLLLMKYPCIVYALPWERCCAEAGN